MMALASPLWAQMPSVDSIYAEAMASARQGDWCHTKYCLLWMALSPDLTPDQLDALRPLLAQAEKELRAERNAEPTKVEPMFPGGDSALSRYIVEHLELPQEQDQYFTQVVVVRMVIEKDGRIAEASVSPGRGFTPEDDEACLQMVRSMPNWRPGAYGCVPTACTCVLPIQLNLEHYSDK